MSLCVSQGGGGDVLRGACGSQEGGGGGAGGGAAALWVTGDCCEGTTIGGTARSAAAGDASVGGLDDALAGVHGHRVSDPEERFDAQGESRPGRHRLDGQHDAVHE